MLGLMTALAWLGPRKFTHLIPTRYQIRQFEPPRVRRRLS